ncbi:MAG: peptidoglycan DD-metalloendopeptidase family protein [Ignavibacteriae bacterium]|nr:peptidoglycan DD-metalloendopeptidase family protein [Ignavibacteriota bacterium]
MKNKKFYYYSPENQKLVQVEKIYFKTVLIFLIVIISTAILTFFVSSKILLNNSIDISYFKIHADNNVLENEMEILEKKFEELNKKIISLNNEKNTLRLAVNLPVNENEKFGIGGSEFESFFPVSINKKNKIKSIYDFVKNVETGIKLEKENFSEIKTKLNENQELFNHIPAISPVNSQIGDRFGVRFHPILKQKRMHNGLDFLSNIGEKVFAPGDGKITFIGEVNGYGKVLKIHHGFGYETVYGHLSSFKVKKGQKISRGELIALTGDSGSLSTGPHLHYEVRHNGISLNPRNFIFEKTNLFDEIKF